MNYQKSYYPRRPVKSFQDLEVYQKLLAVSVAMAKRIGKLDDRGLKSEKSTFNPLPSTTILHRPSSIVNIALGLPVKIAAAHSIRFSDQLGAIAKLEEVMLDCNILVVYLEQYRDIENKEIEAEFFEEQIKNLLTTRMKIMHLQMSWKKFVPQSGILLRRTKFNEDNAGGKNV